MGKRGEGVGKRGERRRERERERRRKGDLPEKKMTMKISFFLNNSIGFFVLFCFVFF